MLNNNLLSAKDLEEFVCLYNPQNRHERRQTWSAKKNPQGQWRAFSYSEIVGRNKTSLDLSWIKDEARREMENLPAPQVLVGEMIKELTGALGELQKLEAELQTRSTSPKKHNKTATRPS